MALQDARQGDLGYVYNNPIQLVRFRKNPGNTIPINDVDPHFQHLFKTIAGNDSEISALELQKILDRVVSQSFQLNTPILEVIVSRYGGQPCSIDFDGFMSCLIRLELLFEMFSKFDKKNSGKIELDIMQVSIFIYCHV
ncbi:Calpain-2 catalytic subunit [Bagarius yarrelli]|uniref:Calpain-2 catalytic subunit n=1 Tax=Bagarius yarrelli TaxID=175774 RepID=A0A556TTW2_BAGYA|nr:Calpain-2 catalytic subunit [Bagarius yarrelli]